MSRDIILSKKASLERCVLQVRNYYGNPSREDFEKNILRQDAIAINLQRAMELAIDMANHLIKEKKLGLPKESKESFTLLEQAGIIPPNLAKKLRGMVGFRNILVPCSQNCLTSLFQLDKEGAPRDSGPSDPFRGALRDL